MNDTTIFVLCGATLLFAAASSIMTIINNSKIKQAMHSIAITQAAILKLHTILKNRLATNAISENAEIIYQDIVQNITPIMRELEISPRDTSEHILWRTIGGLMDEYGKNPFILEKLRRGIKLNTDIARNTDLFLSHAEKLLSRLSETDTDGLLAATFTDGLLGQSVTLFTQAKQLAQNS